MPCVVIARSVTLRASRRYDNYMHLYFLGRSAARGFSLLAVGAPTR